MVQEVVLNHTFSSFGIGSISSSSISTLPVQLISFSGIQKGAFIELMWKTASEINNDHFEIERSIDGKNFEQMTNVKGKGNTVSENDYSFIDNIGMLIQNNINIIYYRLKQIDMNGNMNKGKIISINILNKIGDISLLVTPNPFNSEVGINIFSSQNENAEIQISDITGKEIMYQITKLNIGNNAIEFQKADELNDGVYFIRAVVSGKVFISKIIKQR